MAGFNNDVVYAANVDFTGAFPVIGQVTANGQLLIGAAVAPFIRANTLTAGAGIAITNGVGTITITNTGGGGGGGGATTIAGNSGSAPNIGGVINVIGATGITTTGDGVQTLTITPTGNLAALFALTGTGYVVQTGVNTFIDRTFIAGSGISLTNPDGVAGATTITAGATVPTTFTEDAGTATPSANNINILGTAAQGISTSGAGSTVTITAANSTSTQKGVASFNATEFTVTAGAVASNAITVTAGVGLTTGGSVNLGGTVTLALDIPVTVAHGGTGDITLTNHGVMLGQGTNAVVVTAAGTNGQVLVGGTGVDPAFATVGGTQGVTITGGSNTISIGLVAVPNSALANSSITVIGGAGISVAGSPVSLGGSVTISATGTIVTQFSADVGIATPSGNNINLLGTASQGVSTSASGATVTFTVANATTTTKGVASFNSANFTVSNGAVSLISSGFLQTLTPDVGGAISPTASNINILGQDFGAISLMDTHNVGSSTMNVENRTWPTAFVVDASTTVGARGTFSTIQAAITAAISGQDVFIRPGTYTEDLTLKAGVNLTAFLGDELTPNVIILGKASFSSAGTVSITNIQLKTNADNFLSVTGSAASVVYLENCFLNANNSTGIVYSSSSVSSAVNLYSCNGDCGATGTYFNYSGAGTVFIFSSSLLNTGASTTASTTSATNITIDNCRIEIPLSTSSTGVYTLRNVTTNTRPVNTTALTTGGTGNTVCVFCRFLSGTASAISIGAGTTVQLYSCDIGSTNTNAITGAGKLNYTPLTLTGSSTTINATTQNPQPFGPIIALPAGPQIMAGAGSPSGVVTAPQGSLYLRTDGTTINNRAYINTNSGTTWTALTTAG
jgi:hypothetical protein